MTPSCSSISYFPSAQTRNSRNGPTAAFPEDSIPAHAGKTTPTRRPWCGSSAHPRSRGENQQRLDLGAESRGSSPLTRGKPRPQSWQKRASRLIPAHAGKTRCQLRLRRRGRAHPRSRGENRPAAAQLRSQLDSSPLTRGKPHRRIQGVVARRLIPAHAGKTNFPDPDSRQARAHPRSRGENRLGEDNDVAVSGSSPLTRGKPHKAWTKALQARLIPAHAGKTGHDTPGSSRSSAHPRSRGENPSTLNNGENVNGSSPLTRGKPSPSITSQAGSAAHPRSRGENKDTRSGLWESMGSSPLTRGKPLVFGDLLGNERLIPAHAGKTRTPAQACGSPWAHPRSRGENR